MHGQESPVQHRPVSLGVFPEGSYPPRYRVHAHLAGFSLCDQPSSAASVRLHASRAVSPSAGRRGAAHAAKRLDHQSRGAQRGLHQPIDLLSYLSEIHRHNARGVRAQSGSRQPSRARLESCLNEPVADVRQKNRERNATQRTFDFLAECSAEHFFMRRSIDVTLDEQPCVLGAQRS